jgi:propanol-preferring alcohol dehydrogenase
VNGGFAEYVLADPDYVGHLPDNVDFIDIAPILCAGVTVYKGLKVTDTKPGDWVVISGVGGLGHVAVQYAAAMGLNVLAVDVDDQKLELAKRLGATLAVNARTTDPVAYVQNEIGGAQGVLVTAVSPKAFEQAMHMADGAAPLCSTAFPRATSRCRSSTPCSTVRRCAARSWGRAWISRRRDFAGQGKVKATITTDRLENINDVFEQMKAGKIEGRIVLDFH